MNTATIFTIGIPTLAVLFGILLNRQDATAIRAEMKAEFGQLRNEMIQLREGLHNEMIQLRNGIHTDLVGLHERLATVEAKLPN